MLISPKEEKKNEPIQWKSRCPKNIIKLKGKIHTLKYAVSFIKECILYRVILQSIASRIVRSQVKPSCHIKNALSFDERHS